MKPSPLRIVTWKEVRRSLEIKTRSWCTELCSNTSAQPSNHVRHQSIHDSIPSRNISLTVGSCAPKTSHLRGMLWISLDSVQRSKHDVRAPKKQFRAARGPRSTHPVVWDLHGVAFVMRCGLSRHADFLHRRCNRRSLMVSEAQTRTNEAWP